MGREDYIDISYELDKQGLMWLPEIGDEVALRGNDRHVSILVDPNGMSPKELRNSFVWLPTVEQLVNQIEARQGLIFHAGVTERLEYEAIIKIQAGLIEAKAASLRVAFGKVLNSIICSTCTSSLH